MGMYLTTNRQYIMFLVSAISRYMENPKRGHSEAVIRILRLMKSAMNHGIMYCKTQNTNLKGFHDSDFGSNFDDKKSST